MNYKYVTALGSFVMVFLLTGFLSTKDTVVKTTVVNVATDKVAVPTAEASGAKEPKSPLVQVENKAVNKLEVPASKVLFLQGEVGYNIPSLIKELKQKEKQSKDLYLLIDSPGGSVLDGALLLSAMEASSARIHTVCMGMCASMAFVIHQYGFTRLAIDRAILMAHPASMGISGNVNQIKARLSVLMRYVDKMEAHIAKRAELPPNEFKSLIESEFWIDSEDALQKKLVDKIVDINTDASQDGEYEILGNKSKKTITNPAQPLTVTQPNTEQPNVDIIW